MKSGMQNAECGITNLLFYIIISLLIISLVGAQPLPSPEAFADTTQIPLETEAFSPSPDSDNAFSRGIETLNAFFTAEGIKKYSKLIDFIVFFIIFTSVFLIGLRIAFKDKGVSHQTSVLAIALGLMSSLALIFGGTFLGREISIVNLFPFALWFLGFAGFALIYWILHLLMGKKHPIWAFILALIITGLIILLFTVFAEKVGTPSGPGKPGKPGEPSDKKEPSNKKFGFPGFKKGEPPIKDLVSGYFVRGKTNEFADKDGIKLADQDAEKKTIEEVGIECKVQIRVGADNELDVAEGVNKAAKRQANDIKIAKGRCKFLEDIAGRHFKDCEKTFTPTDTKSHEARFYIIECKEAAYEPGRGPGSCDALTSFNVETFLGKIWNADKNIYHKGGITRLKQLKKALELCKKEVNYEDLDSVNAFQEAAWKYYSKLAEGWFRAGRYDKALEALIALNELTGGEGNNVTNSSMGEEILKLWYDELISGHLQKLRIGAKKRDDAAMLINIGRELDTAKTKRNEKIINKYTRP